jgi:hypothetical protein
MSGPIPSAVAEAAHLHALQAEAAARGLSLGRTIGARFREAAEARKGREPDSLPGRTWRAMSLRVRTVVVMLGGSAGDPKEAARQPWESFGDAERASMGAVARELGQNLRDAACLF